ncbi:hypothetical protein Sango_0012300 [Sesamum angolense]|uniref:DDE Tnp4 domain-containing protein n=1 Tax=Sesamum angolense TaxID=2727404 RepID=A0AAE1XDF1_9LAMI|nr:hypothetical protein Sango_0012300 [Sesamum angolense]
MLFDVHCSESYTAKSMLDELEMKYNTEEDRLKKYYVSKFMRYQMVEGTSVAEITLEQMYTSVPINLCLCLIRPSMEGQMNRAERVKIFVAIQMIIVEGCLGALDGTHIEVRVPDSDKGRYRNRKGQISVNVLGVCNMEGKFVYALSGWEDSAADGRILRAIHRPTGLKVPTGNYYLCDNRYSNVEGFLTPYRGIRYHLNEWDRGCGGPQTAHELFNLRHASARNIIERTFGLLKTRWGILRSPSYYNIRVQSDIIIACCLLHNFVHTEMPDDPLELELPDNDENRMDHGVEFVSTIDTNPA